MMNRMIGVAYIIVAMCGLILMTDFFMGGIDSLTVSVSNTEEKNTTTRSRIPEKKRQDGRFIPRLCWTAPEGELPGTYADYLKRRPLWRGVFSHSRLLIPFTMGYDYQQKDISNISILVDGDLFPEIQDALDLYIADLLYEGYVVFMETVDGGTPEEIKNWVRQRYLTGSQGVVFVGDITAAWAEVSGSIFPCDLFYMDMDGYWADPDEDGIYEVHSAGSGDQEPEVYVARINAHLLQYDTESTMINRYFGKAHDYRIGKLSRPWGGLEYVDEDWYSMDVALDLVYRENVVRYDFGYFTTAEDYLDQLALGQHFVQVCAHSYSGGHHFGTRPTQSASYAHVYVYSPKARSVRILFGSDDGIKVWLNGINVLTSDVYQGLSAGWQPDRYPVDVELNQGWNRLLCKISQEGGDYQFSARFTDLTRATIPDLKYQINNPETNSREAEFVRGWLLNGFHQDTSNRFWYYLTTNYLGIDEGSVNPHEGEIMGGKIWTVYSTGSPYINMAEYCQEAIYGACHAFARIYAPTEVQCQLWLGYDDGARVWLNGQEVLYDNRYGDFEADMSRVNVTLHEGTNRLMVKVSEWTGEHGFSARFCYSDGRPVEGLTYDPEPLPISYIGTWLFNGPYPNADWKTRLSEDYLGDEADVYPSEEEKSGPVGLWLRGIGNGFPFDIANFYDHGEFITSQDIQDVDAPVLFYNLFACGPGRFTDENYLAGAYIFNTTTSLITVASAKSGSMLNFDEFTRPLGERKTMGEAFLEWFQHQAPFDLWEREWYYGMVLCGDPTLRLVNRGDLNDDGCVDGFDLEILLSALGVDTGGDINGDGDTDQVDLGILLSRWGDGCL